MPHAKSLVKKNLLLRVDKKSITEPLTKNKINEKLRFGDMDCKIWESFYFVVYIFLLMNYLLKSCMPGTQLHLTRHHDDKEDLSISFLWDFMIVFSVLQN